MYAENFQKSLALVEAAREKNIALEPARMTAEQKETLLATFHPDYKADEFVTLTELFEIKGVKLSADDGNLYTFVGQ